MRPLASVAGTRWTRCTPRSNLSRLQAPLPWMKRMISLKPPTPVGWLSITSTFHFWRSAYLVYMRARSAAKSAASSPPAPARISTKTLRSSLGSRGRSSARSSSSRRLCCAGQVVHLGLGQLAHLAIGVLGHDVAGLGEALEHALVVAELLHHLGELGGGLRGARVLAGLADHLRVGEPAVRARRTAPRAGAACQTYGSLRGGRAGHGTAARGEGENERKRTRTPRPRLRKPAGLASPPRSASCCTSAGSARRGPPCPRTSACPCRTDGTWSTPPRGSPGTVERVWMTSPQLQVMVVSTYSG